MIIEHIHNPLVHAEKKRVAVIIRGEQYEVIDLDMSEEQARELHKKLGQALERFNN